jgi:hypothetical protein
MGNQLPEQTGSPPARRDRFLWGAVVASPLVWMLTLGQMVVINMDDSLLPPPWMVLGMFVLAVTAMLWLALFGVAFFRRRWRQAASLMLSAAIFVVLTDLGGSYTIAIRTQLVRWSIEREIAHAGAGDAPKKIVRELSGGSNWSLLVYDEQDDVVPPSPNYDGCPVYVETLGTHLYRERADCSRHQ